VPTVPITFTRLTDYLEAVADHGNLDASDSGHGRFWKTDYPSFINGVVPSKKCNGAPVPIIQKPDMVNSAFFQILQAKFCTNMPQMPKTGPFVTDGGYSVTLRDGTAITGTQIVQDIRDWLNAGAPENG